MHTITKMRYAFSTPGSQTLKRFYKSSYFIPNPSPQHHLHKYLIKLDDKTMKTPYRHQLAVPSTLIAMLVCNQFNRQDKYIKSGEMPMLGLSRIAVDADLEGHIGQHLKNTIYQYLKTDTLNFYQPYYQPQYTQSSLPLVQNFSTKFNIPITPSSSLTPPLLTPSPQFESFIQTLNNWQLIALETMTVWMKSTICAYNLLNNGDIDTCLRAAMLEQIVQMEQNGEVEEKIMGINQVRLMATCGLILWQNGIDDGKGKKDQRLMENGEKNQIKN